MQKGSINRVILVGRLGSKPEFAQTPGGTNVANFNLATNESRKNSEGINEDKTKINSKEREKRDSILAFKREKNFVNKILDLFPDPPATKPDPETETAVPHRGSRPRLVQRLLILVLF